ncbi:MAG: PilZ domain-containing protein [Candidatus Saelkia tenebricola]|nr:PilZ domain-containing protein [Candidatus Saelkia tenebricola]
MEERRKYLRLSKSLQINYQDKRLDALNILGGCRTKDISCGGLCFPTAYDLPFGDILKIDISLPEFLNPVKSEGKIVWKKEEFFGNYRYLLGIKFTEIEADEECKLYGYINRRIEEKARTFVSWIG